MYSAFISVAHQYYGTLKACSRHFISWLTLLFSPVVKATFASQLPRDISLFLAFLNHLGRAFQMLSSNVPFTLCMEPHYQQSCL